MILRFLRQDMLALLAILLSNPPLPVYSLADFDCQITVNESKFDLTSLAGEHVLNRTRSTPPTTMVDSLRFDLCADLKHLDSMPEHDQCPSGTRVCLTKVNSKEGEKDRITSVIPLAQTSTLDLAYSVSHDPKALSLQLHGATYAGTSTPQSLNLTVFCNPEGAKDPEFVAYDGTRLDLEWRSPAGCPFLKDTPDDGGNKEPGPDKGGKKEESVGSGIGWFFLVILLAFAAYFGLGAYYNYSTYGATGLDLLPHRDFWMEVPYMLKDVVSHLCSSARPRRSTRGGYVAV